MLRYIMSVIDTKLDFTLMTKSYSRFKMLILFFLLCLNNSTFSIINKQDDNNITLISDSVQIKQDSIIMATGDSLLFQRYKIHLGAEVTNLVHLGMCYRVSDITMLELNLAAMVPNYLFYGVFGLVSLGINIQLFDDKNWLINANIPAWFTVGGFEYGYFDHGYLFPSINIGWYSSSKKRNYYENVMIRGGISYFAHYNIRTKNLKPQFLFFNLGVQIGWSWGK